MPSRAWHRCICRAMLPCGKGRYDMEQKELNPKEQGEVLNRYIVKTAVEIGAFLLILGVFALRHLL